MFNSLNLVKYRLDDSVREMLEKTIEDRVHGTALDPDANTAILAGIGAHALRTYLPGEVLHALGVFTATGQHALVLENLPQQEFPATPVRGFADENGLAIINAVHLGLLQVLGVTPYAVDYENSGRLIRNVVPNPSAAGTTSSWGADTEFFWHTDNPHLPFVEPGSDPRPSVPRYLTFYAVRNSEAVPTEVMAVEAALERLDRDTVASLAEPVFSVAAPDSNDETDDGGRRVLQLAPVLEHHGVGQWVRYDRGTTGATTDEAVAALDRWVGALEAAASWAPVLESGQFLVFDNYRVLHRRRAFAPAADATARWLRRCYAS